MFGGDSTERESALVVVGDQIADTVSPDKKRRRKRKGKGDILALPEHVILQREYPEAPKGIFSNIADSYFSNLAQVFKRQMRDYHFFLKFQKYVPITHFSERPERASNTYEKKYWNLTLFNRLCCLLRQKSKHLATAPFSTSGDYPTFEKQILYSPQTCPIYVERSRSIMECNLNRFKKVIYTTHSDAYDSDSLKGNILEEADSSIQLKKFIRQRTNLPDDYEFTTPGDDISLVSSKNNQPKREQVPILE